MITPQQAIERLISNNELFYDEMTDLMRQIMSGQVPPEQIAAILTGLRIKVETVSEITAAASVMREFATKVPLENADDLVDIVGTGGDGAGLAQRMHACGVALPVGAVPHRRALAGRHVGGLDDVLDRDRHAVDG